MVRLELRWHAVRPADRSGIMIRKYVLSGSGGITTRYYSTRRFSDVRSKISLVNPAVILQYISNAADLLYAIHLINYYLRRLSPTIHRRVKILRILVRIVVRIGRGIIFRIGSRIALGSSAE